MRVRLVGACEADYTIIGDLIIDATVLFELNGSDEVENDEPAEVIDFPGTSETTEVCAAA